jgi:hypothetical protein
LPFGSFAELSKGPMMLHTTYSSPSIPFSSAWSNALRCQRRMHSSALSPSLPSFILLTPSLHPSPTSSGGVSPPSCLSRPSSHPGMKTMRSGSHIGSFLGSSILRRALPSVPSSTISRGTFPSGLCSSSGCNFLHSASVPFNHSVLPGSSFPPAPGRANDLLHRAEACLRKSLSPQRIFPVPFQRHCHGGGSA